MDNRTPSLLRILWTDYWAFVGLAGIAIIWAFWGFDRLTTPGPGTDTILPFAAGITVLDIILIIWRVRVIGSAFEDGLELDGMVTGVSYFRDRCRVAYTYSVNGERFQTSAVVMRQRRTQALQPGQPVVVMANRDRPKIAALRDLYR